MGPYDPSVGARLDTIDINEAILNVRWESLWPGPIGEYIEVVDIDPASQCCYAPIDLNDPYLLTVGGLPPSEASPQFHQQMAYAVAMKTIEHFERALGRVALWAPRRITHQDGRFEEKFVQRLRIYPHALRTKNAYYSPDRIALLLGYFAASSDFGATVPGAVVFTAVSHDIVAHETTHALLHGFQLRSIEPTNPDVFAFHEAFADIVALFQHFTLPKALRHQIAVTKGDLEKQNLLGQLAVQFGQATDRFGALRDYIGKVVKVESQTDTAKVGTDNQKDERTWVRLEARRTDYDMASEPHERGAVLVTAVFDAFLQIYKRRKADLIRLATGGSGILPDGEISVDLVNRLASEASKVAGHVLNMCIRALDYCPPDLTFGEYLRAIITADTDLVPDDKHHHRTAFVTAFRDGGIYPRDVKHPSPGSLLWEPPPLPIRSQNLMEILSRMSLEWDLNTPRRDVFGDSRNDAYLFWNWLMDSSQVSEEEIANLGLFRIASPELRTIDGIEGELRRIEVHAVRPARRVGPEGNVRFDIIVELSQTFRPSEYPGLRIRGGSTLIIDFATRQIRYLIRKKLRPKDRIASYFNRISSDVSLRANYFSGEGRRTEPFALMHHVHG
jgi:quinol monooxygenase YgiN